jgi:uncharacterized protein (TIGR02246 family)
MKSLFSMVAAAAVFSAVSAGDAAPATDATQIRSLEQQFAAAFSAKDVDAIMKVYVPDDSLFVFDIGVPRQHVGAADYRKDWQQFFATFKGPLKFEVTDVTVTIDGTTAYGHSIQHTIGTDTKGARQEFAVRVTDVYRKIDGKWLIVQEHVSVPIDFATGKPDMMSRP